MPGFDTARADECRTVRQTLELARPAEGDPRAMQRALAHVEKCPACRAAVQLQTRVDQRIGTLMRDVEVPAGLKDRLLTAMQIAAAGPVTTTTACAPGESTFVRPADAPQGMNRRRWLRVASAAACVLAAGTVWYLVRPSRVSIALDDLEGLALDATIVPQELPVLAAFSDGTTPRLPGTMRTGPLEGILPRRLGKCGAALYVFSLPAAGGAVLDGRLVELPAKFVKDPPGTQFFLEVPATYSRGFRTSAWVEGDRVYLCCLNGAGNQLQRLQKPQPQAI